MNKTRIIILLISTIVSLVVFSSMNSRKNQHDVSDSSAVISSEYRGAPSAQRDSSSQMRSSSRQDLPYDFPETTYWKRELRPFDVTHQEGLFSWTAEDGMTEEVMKKLANNSLMLDELRRENQYTIRRQLIYVDPSIENQKQDILDGKLSEITLPGFNGELFNAQVTSYEKYIPESPEEAEGEESGGAFNGGDESLRVQVGLSDSSWSIGIIHNERQFELITREPNEWIISEIDPEKLEEVSNAEARSN